MITTLSTDWGAAWGMAGISVGVVFAILILLVGVLYVFSAVASGKAAKEADAAKPKVVTGANYIKSKQADIATASDLDKVAIATAVYLYMGNQHDEESGILTIHHTDNTAWHAELNRHL
ncbi:MAG: OadG family protein [Bacteroidaceae bacterium]|nr:OadG family protein [Bacteroidaceae bacterium]